MKIIIACAFFVAYCFCESQEKNTLKSVHVFFRHGSRTPELKDVYPNDPHQAESFQPMGYGQLTNDGKAMAFKLGKNLRKRYDSFLGRIYTPDTVKATSTDFDRTKMSALLALAGLFEPSESQKWNDNLSWLPIPYDYEKDSRDFSLKRPNSYCPTYMKQLEQVLHSEETLAYLKQHKKTLEYISEKAGRPINKLLDVFGIYQTLKAEETMNLTLPDWTTSVWPQPITAIAAKQCELENSNTILKKLNGGRMLAKVVEQMLEKSKGGLGRKIYLYSGHENNVINILSALNLFETHFPSYSSAVMLELHYLGEEKGYAVKVYYSENVEQEAEEKQLKGCDILCPLDTFVELTKPFIPKNYTQECHSHVYLG